MSVMLPISICSFSSSNSTASTLTVFFFTTIVLPYVRSTAIYSNNSTVLINLCNVTVLDDITSVSNMFTHLHFVNRKKHWCYNSC